MQTLYQQVFAGNGFNKYGHYVRGELLLYPTAACVTTEAGRGSTYGACSANFDGGSDPSVGGSFASLSRLSSFGGALSKLYGFTNKSVVAKPFGWQRWWKNNATKGAVTRVRPATPTAQQQTVPATTAAAAPSIDPSTSAAKDAQTGLAGYLLGGSGK